MNKVFTTAIVAGFALALGSSAALAGCQGCSGYYSSGWGDGGYDVGSDAYGSGWNSGSGPIKKRGAFADTLTDNAGLLEVEASNKGAKWKFTGTSFGGAAAGSHIETKGGSASAGSYSGVDGWMDYGVSLGSFNKK